MKMTEQPGAIQPFFLPEDRQRAQEILDAMPVKPIRRVTTEMLGGVDRWRNGDRKTRRREE